MTTPETAPGDRSSTLLVGTPPTPPPTEPPADPAVTLRAALRRIRQLKDETKALRAAAAPAEIAVTGVGCRLPGGISGPDGLWDAVLAGRCLIGPVPAERWDAEHWYDPRPATAGRAYSRVGGFLPDGVKGFDAQLFGLSAREAVGIDPQHRLVLEVVWEALEDAGLAPDQLRGRRVGVFVGAGGSDYERLGAGAGAAEWMDAYGATGCASNFAANRVSYLLGLTGPSLVVDTACSSSLVAVHLAARSLAAGECDLAVAVGVNVLADPAAQVALCQARMLSPSGVLRAFGAEADGYVRGEGCGAVVLSRTAGEQARPYGMILGSAVNQDGHTSGLTVPSGPAQETVIRRALASAGLTGAQVGYVEAHGTGTALGDPIEVRALSSVLGRERSDHDGRLVLGSVKANLGHLEAGAGIVGLIKALLVVQRACFPPQVNVGELNPAVDWDVSPVEVPREARAWEGSGRRVAGVSSFGYGGTNAHVLVGAVESQTSQAVPDGSDDCPPILLKVTGATPSALSANAGRLADHLLAHPAETSGDWLRAVAWTAGTARADLTERALVTGTTVAGIADGLRQIAAGGGRRGRRAPSGAPALTWRIPASPTSSASPAGSLSSADLVLQQPGHHRATAVQGSRLGVGGEAQRLDHREDRLPAGTASPAGSALPADPAPSAGAPMSAALRQLHRRHPDLTALIDRLARVAPAALRPALGQTREIPLVTEDPVARAVVGFAVVVATGTWWSMLGLKPHTVHGLGDSPGAAAVLAGVLEPDDGLRLLLAGDRPDPALTDRIRPARVALTYEPGTPAATLWESLGARPRDGRDAGTGTTTRELDLSIDPGQRSAGPGDRSAVGRVAGTGTATREFGLSTGPDQGAAIDNGGRFGTRPDVGQSPGTGTTTGKFGLSADPSQKAVVDCGEELGARSGTGRSSGTGTGTGEFGRLADPRQGAGTDLGGGTDDGRGSVVGASAGGPGLSVDPARDVAADYWLAGGAVRWDLLLSPSGRTVRLPGYAWQHEEYWYSQLQGVTSGSSVRGRGLAPEVIPLLDGGAVGRLTLSAATTPLLAEHRVHGRLVVPGVVHLELLLRTLEAASAEERTVTGLRLVQPLVVEADEQVEIQVLVGPQTEEASTISLASRRVGGAWVRHLWAEAVPVNEKDGGGREDEEATTDGADGYGEAIDGAAFYREHWHPEFVLGESFRLVRSLRRGPGGELAAVLTRPSGRSAADRSGVRAELLVLDACVQLIGALNATTYRDGPVRLGTGFRTFEQHTRHLPDTVLATAAPDTPGEVVVRSPQGRLLARLTGVEFRPVSRARIDPDGGPSRAPENDDDLRSPDRERLTAGLRRLAGRILQEDPAGLDPELPLAERMDSLMVTELTTALGDLGHRVDAADVLEAGTLDALAGLLASGPAGPTAPETLAPSSPRTPVVVRTRRPHKRPQAPKALTTREMSAYAQLPDGFTVRPEEDPATAPDGVFLTGATGFVGAFLLAELLDQTPGDIHCLVRADDVEHARRRLEQNLAAYGLDPGDRAGRIRPVPGDLTRPRFGLSEKDFQDLHDRVGQIVHNGAMVKWTYGLDQLAPHNVGGTREVLALATAGAARPVHLTSTVGVFSSAQADLGIVDEDLPLGEGGPLVVGYAQSKWIGEHLVREAGARGLPFTIHRINTGGHSRTGAFNRLDHLSMVLKGCVEAKAAPLSGRFPLQAAPIDYVARAFVALSQDRSFRGRTSHLLNRVPMEWSELFDHVEDFGYPMSRSSFEDWRAFVTGRSSGTLALLGLAPFLNSTIDHVHLAVFDDPHTRKALSGTGITCPALDRDLVHILLRGFVERGFVPAPPPRPVPGTGGTA